MKPGGPSLALARADFDEGVLDGVGPAGRGAGIVGLHPTETGTWTGPWIRPGFPVTEVIASWAAETPPGAQIEIAVQGVTAVGFETGWYVLGRWARDDRALRTSVAGQDDELGRVDVDVFRAAVGLDAYRLLLTLRAGRGGAASVRSLVSLAAAEGEAGGGEAGAPAADGGVELPVPAYSQAIHKGEYPELDNGGSSWCSPTSTAMIVAFWGTGPTSVDTSWVDAAYADPWVDHAARQTYDAAYGGCGNWPFNTAYAAGFGLDAFVTRLRSLREAELFLRAGIPLAASIAAGPGELDGYPHAHGTRGHLVVLTGLTAAGDPIVNDPAAASNEEVHRVYDRAQFERAWLGGSGGVVYVIRRPEVPLPPSSGNW